MSLSVVSTYKAQQSKWKYQVVMWDTGILHIRRKTQYGLGLEKTPGRDDITLEQAGEKNSLKWCMGTPLPPPTARTAGREHPSAPWHRQPLRSRVEHLAQNNWSAAHRNVLAIRSSIKKQERERERRSGYCLYGAQQGRGRGVGMAQRDATRGLLLSNKKKTPIGDYTSNKQKEKALEIYMISLPCYLSFAPLNLKW